MAATELPSERIKRLTPPLPDARVKMGNHVRVER